MKFFKLSIAVALAAFAFVTPVMADDGRMYDSCISAKVATSVATELRDLDNGDVAEDGLVINAAYSAGECESIALELNSVALDEVDRLEGDGTDYVVLRAQLANGTRYLVVEEARGEPMHDLIDDVAATVACGVSVVGATPFTIDNGECQ